MVSYHGYFQYQNIIQAEPIEKKEKCYIKKDTISGYLQNHPEFKLFNWIIKKADMELKMGNEMFNSTIFIVDDNNLLKQFGSEDFFTSLDKNQAFNILNSHIINRKIHKETLYNQKLSKIFTKNEKTQFYFLNNNGLISINNSSKIKEDLILSNGIIYIIDKLILPIF